MRGSARKRSHCRCSRVEKTPGLTDRSDIEIFSARIQDAEVVELVDALDSKSSGLRPVSVRVRPPAFRQVMILLSHLPFFVSMSRS